MRVFNVSSLGSPVCFTKNPTQLGSQLKKVMIRQLAFTAWFFIVAKPSAVAPHPVRIVPHLCVCIINPLNAEYYTHLRLDPEETTSTRDETLTI